jgi:hypothetical protein
LSYVPSTRTLTTTIFSGTATTARYADLAENYAADAYYEPGTTLIFGGNNEVTLANDAMSTKVAGVVSTNPAYLMNNELDAEYVVSVALQGRVPAKIVGPVGKGDLLVSAAGGNLTACNTPVIGSIVGKSLENFTATSEIPNTVIEIVVTKG